MTITRAWEIIIFTVAYCIHIFALHEKVHLFYCNYSEYGIFFLYEYQAIAERMTKILFLRGVIEAKCHKYIKNGEDARKIDAKQICQCRNCSKSNVFDHLGPNSLFHSGAFTSSVREAVVLGSLDIQPPSSLTANPREGRREDICCPSGWWDLGQQWKILELMTKNLLGFK